MFSSSEAQALPIFQRLYQKRYGSRVPCNACHESFGGTPLNPFGRDFARAGMDYEAFEAIEAKDSDKDGGSNLAEARAGSNPGHPASTIKSPGPWLERAAKEGVPIPREWLVRVFPDASSFAGEEAELADAEASALAEELGEEPSLEEGVPTYYRALRPPSEGAQPAPYGTALLVYLPGRDGTVVLGLAVDLELRVVRAVLLRHGGHRALGEPSWLAQFQGLAPGFEWSMGEDTALRPNPADPEASEAAARALHRALAVLAKVRGRPPGSGD